MLESPPSSPRKRQRLEPPEQTGTSQSLYKKQRPDHFCGSQPPPAFWDNLSKIWLTKRALRELDRRNSQACPRTPRPPRARRPVTRSFFAKRNANSQSTKYVADYLRRCKPRTFEDIKLFARHGGPDLSDVRNCPNYRTMSSSHSSVRSDKLSTATLSTRLTTDTIKTKSTGVYNRNFQQHLIDNAVYPCGYRKLDGEVPAKPGNWTDVHQILAQPRPSLSPSRFTDKDHEKFVQADEDAAKEKQVSEAVIPIIEGNIRDAKCRAGGIPFTNLDPLTDGAIKPGNPDIYYGARPEQLHRNIRNEIGGLIIPSTQHDLPIAPNFFLAVKGPDGSAAVAKRQACYDGALGARGMHSLQSYAQDEAVYSVDASTITSIYHNGQLQMYTSHVVMPASPGGRIEYHMHQLKGWSMTGDPETFRQGAGAYRNARDWAEQQRDEAIMRANARANSVEAEASTGNLATSPALSFVTAVSETELYTISQYQDFCTLDEESNTPDSSGESEGSAPIIPDKFPAKRSNEHLEPVQRRQKRHNAGEVEAELALNSKP
ncbi:hypothetical protein K458DRAFT_474582 [Lentithecium fluviatile CBS 122367]|uniref:Uncharacterized protein n=1 Tax=Lentithecium fluviatile CBS 122367 TaxID=1168545 RepID=A0A6G1JIK3_9PLEO|nr:hypothetical protein K458DRAFT_474582 [Lentithecium fluviatile CBS 122367]